MTKVKRQAKKYWNNLWKLLSKKELAILPGQLAYFFVLSIIPIITLLFFLANQMNLSYDTITNFVKDSFSQDIAGAINPIIEEGTRLDFKLIIFLFITFVIATNAANSIIISSNTIFNIPDSPLLNRRIKAIVLTIIMIILMIFILIVPVFGQTILNLLVQFGVEANSLDWLHAALPILKWPITVFVIFLFIKVIYTIAPDSQIPSKYVNRGSLFTTGLWVGSTYIYSYYITNVAKYDIFYGSLANIVVLMLWFYLMAYIFVLGMAINYDGLEKEEQKKELKLQNAR